jgi:hypothetical protein
MRLLERGGGANGISIAMFGSIGCRASDFLGIRDGSMEPFVKDVEETGSVSICVSVFTGSYLHTSASLR